jgi:hypothetical protein
MRKCEEKKRLVAAYLSAREHFEAFPTALHHLETSPQVAYESLQQNREEARLKAEHALRALEAHLGVHSC